MSKMTDNKLKAKKVAAIETTLGETRADIAAGCVVKVSVAKHVERLKSALACMGEEKGDILNGPLETDWEALS